MWQPLEIRAIVDLNMTWKNVLELICELLEDVSLLLSTTAALILITALEVNLVLNLQFN